MRILGIDPGLATVGFSVVDTDKAKMKLVTCGVISTPAHTSLSSRLDRIFCDMNELISTFSPDVMSIEELFFNTNINIFLKIIFFFITRRINNIYTIGRYGAWTYCSMEDCMLEAKNLSKKLV